jgi:acetyl esterase/lipase
VALALLAVAVGIAVAFSAYQLSVQPGAAIVKAAFETGSEVTPPADFAGADKAVTQELGISIGVATGPDATVDIFTPSAPATTLRPIILWVHGGGFISSSSATVRDYAVMLANAGYTVASLDYTLAPGAHHPTPVVQANAALAFLHEHAGEYGGDPTRIVIGGDSAGAQIAGETAAVQTNPALASALDLEPALTHAELRAVVLFCGLYDMRTVGSTGFPALRTYLWAYTGVREYTHYADIDLLSVAAHVTSDFPPTFLTVGDADPFATQADELDAALELQAVPTTTLFWTDTGAGLGHEYQFDFALPEAGQAFAATLAFLTASTEETP